MCIELEFVAHARVRLRPGLRKPAFIWPCLQRREAERRFIDPDLVRLTKEQAGVEATSSLIEMAVANLVAEVGFPETFSKALGRVHTDIDLGV